MAETTTANPLGHNSERFIQWSMNAAKHADRYPFGYSPEKLTIPEGEREATYGLWSDNEKIEVHIWLATPGRYECLGTNRLNFLEVTCVMAGEVTVSEDGHQPITMRAGDTLVMKPGWKGTWDVTEYLEKAFVWIYL